MTTNQNTMCDCLGCAVEGACCATSEELVELSARDMEAVVDAINNRTPPNAALLLAHERFRARNAQDVPLGDPKLALVNAAQRRFDERYISSLEIADRVKVSRPAVLHARATGKLPEPICVNGGQIYIWEREEVEPFLAAWEMSVRMRRGEQVVVQTGPGLNVFHDSMYVQVQGRAMRPPRASEAPCVIPALHPVTGE